MVDVTTGEFKHIEGKANFIFRFLLWLARNTGVFYIEYPERENRKREEPEVGLSLHYYWPFSRSHKRPCPVRAYIVYGFFLIITIHYTSMAVVYLRFAQGIKRWKVLMEDYADKNQTGECILASQLNQIDLTTLKNLEDQINLLESLGLATLTINDIAPFCLLSMSFFVLLSVLPAAPLDWNFNLPALTFRFRPDVEASRMKGKLKQLLEALILEQLNETNYRPSLIGKTIDLLYTQFNNSRQTHDWDSPEKLRYRLFKTTTRWIFSVAKSPGMASGSQGNRVSERKYPYFIISRDHLDQLIPDYLKTVNHKEFMQGERTFILMSWLGNSITNYFIHSALTYGELINRIEQHRNQLHCASIHEMAVPRSFPIRLKPLDWTPDSSIGRDYLDGKLSSFELMYRYELGPMFPRRVVMVYCSLFFCYILMLFIYGTFTYEMSMDQVIQSIWIRQIRTQLQEITSRFKLAGNRKHLSRRTRHMIEPELCKVYVNFVLYRSELKNHQKILSFVANCFGVLISACLIVCFVCFTESEPEAKTYIWTIVLIGVMFFNYISYLSVSLTSKLDQAFNEITIIMARLCEHSMQHSYIVRLWRRHLLSSTELHSHYGIKFLGLELNKSNLTRINTQIIGASIFIYKYLVN